MVQSTLYTNTKSALFVKKIEQIHNRQSILTLLDKTQNQDKSYQLKSELVPADKSTDIKHKNPEAFRYLTIYLLR